LVRQKELAQFDKFQSRKESILCKLDSDKDGKVDLIDTISDLISLLRKHQKEISIIDKLYIHNFVKISNHLKYRGENIQELFVLLKKKGGDEKEFNKIHKILKEQIESYELILFHSFHMVTALMEGDYITFHEIYESFDELKIFNTNWENEVLFKLNDIKLGLEKMLNSISSFESNIISRLNTLTYVTQTGFSDLNNSVIRELKSIDSSLELNNILTGISTYQLYKINKQTKGLLK